MYVGYKVFSVLPSTFSIAEVMTKLFSFGKVNFNNFEVSANSEEKNNFFDISLFDKNFPL